MRNIALICLIILKSTGLQGEPSTPGDTLVYLFPGQGSDARLFKHLKLPDAYDTVHISYPLPEKREGMKEYAHRFISQIDRDSPFILVGVSLGGMLCTELTDTLDPLKTIIISSAKTTNELPGRYTFQQVLPLNRIIPKRLTKGGARLLQGIVEPDRRFDKSTFKDMLKNKDPLYLKRTVDMIVNWNRSSYPGQIVHIHGDKDHTIPIKNVEYDYLIEDGSHMMMITRAREINEIIAQILEHVPAP